MVYSLYNIVSYTQGHHKSDVSDFLVYTVTNEALPPTYPPTHSDFLALIHLENLRFCIDFEKF